jgi:hypothetical protein
LHCCGSMHLPEGLLEAIRREVEPAYLLDRSGRIVFLNDAWDRLARANAAPASLSSAAILGTRWIDGIHGRVRRFYSALLGRAFSLERAARPAALVHLGECNTPEPARTQATRFVPLYTAEESTPQWMLLFHCIVAETAMQTRHPVGAEGMEPFRTDDRPFTQCGCCRRTRVADDTSPKRWELIPEWVARPPEDTAWDLCRTCFESWYGLPQLETLKPTRTTPTGRASGAWVAAARLPG